MKNLFIFLAVVCIMGGISCTTKHTQSIHHPITPDSGVNINIASLYPVQDDSSYNAKAGLDHISQTPLLDTPSDSASYWADMYMDDFINWEERVGTKQMLGWKRYPSWYGGFYIENGKMVFLLTSESGVKTLPEGALWKKCEYSHNELEAIKKEVNNGISKHLDVFIAAGTEIDDKANRVVVYLRNNSPEAIKLFKEKVYNGDAVIIA